MKVVRPGSKPVTCRAHGVQLFEGGRQAFVRGPPLQTMQGEKEAPGRLADLAVVGEPPDLCRVIEKSAHKGLVPRRRAAFDPAKRRQAVDQTRREPRVLDDLDMEILAHQFIAIPSGQAVEPDVVVQDSRPLRGRVGPDREHIAEAADRCPGQALGRLERLRQQMFARRKDQTLGVVLGHHVDEVGDGPVLVLDQC